MKDREKQGQKEHGEQEQENSSGGRRGMRRFPSAGVHLLMEMGRHRLYLATRYPSFRADFYVQPFWHETAKRGLAEEKRKQEEKRKAQKAEAEKIKKELEEAEKAVDASKRREQIKKAERAERALKQGYIPDMEPPNLTPTPPCHDLNEAQLDKLSGFYQQGHSEVIMTCQTCKEKMTLNPTWIATEYKKEKKEKSQ